MTMNMARAAGSRDPMGAASHKAVEQFNDAFYDGTALPEGGPNDAALTREIPMTPQERKEMLACEVLKYREQARSLQLDIEQLQATHDKALQELRSSKADAEDAKIAVAKAEATLEATKSSFTRTEQEAATTADQAAKLQAEVEKLEMILADTTKETGSIKDQSAANERRLAEALAQLEADAKEKEDSIQADIAEAHATLEAARLEAMELDSRLSAHREIQAENGRLRAALQRMHAWDAHCELHETMSDSKNEVDRLKQILANARDERISVTSEVAQLRAERDNLRAQLEAAVSVAERAEKEVTTTRRELAFDAIAHSRHVLDEPDAEMDMDGHGDFTGFSEDASAASGSEQGMSQAALALSSRYPELADLVSEAQELSGPGARGSPSSAAPRAGPSDDADEDQVADAMDTMQRMLTQIRHAIDKEMQTVSAGL